MELELAECKVYQKSLEDHVAELENLCSILHDQIDEQQKYIVQKEISMRKQIAEENASLINEKQSLADEIDCLKLQLDRTRRELDDQLYVSVKLKQQIEEKDGYVKEMNNTNADLSKMLEMKNADVKMLRDHNNDLSGRLSDVQHELNNLQKTLSEAAGPGEHANLEALRDIQKSVLNYFKDQQRQEADIESASLCDRLNKISQYESQLAEERRKRLSAEIKVENLSVELEKSKVETAMRRYCMRGSKAKRSNMLQFLRNAAISRENVYHSMDRDHTQSLDGIDHRTVDRANVRKDKILNVSFPNAVVCIENMQSTSLLQTSSEFVPSPMALERASMAKKRAEFILNEIHSK